MAQCASKYRQRCQLPLTKPEDLRGGSPEENTSTMKALLAGDKSAYRDIVVLNSAAGLIVASQAENLENGARMAEQAIDSARRMTHSTNSLNFTTD